MTKFEIFLALCGYIIVALGVGVLNAIYGVQSYERGSCDAGAGFFGMPSTNGFWFDSGI